MRSLLVSLHKYTGIILGLALSVTGITGSAIVFDRELDELVEPAIASFQPATAYASLDLALSNAAAAVGGVSEPTRIALGRHESAPHIVRFPTEVGNVGPTEVTVDPGTGNVTSVRVWGEYPVTWLYRLHYSFMAGESGELVVGVLGIALLFFCISGVIIWLPRQGFRSLRHAGHAFSVRLAAGARVLNYDLHKLIGILSFPMLVVIAFTGIEMVWHEPVEKLVAALLPLKEEPNPESREGESRISVDQVQDVALASLPNARVYRIYLPRNKTDPFQVGLIQAGERWREYGASTLWIDQYSGAVLEVWDSQNLPSGNTFLNWMFPLHNGDALGLAGRVTVFICGLLPSFFFITGLYLWLRRRADERRQLRSL